MRIVSPYTYPQHWLKGNLHTHTERSDGTDAVDDVIAMYRDDGYDFLALTDHDRLSVGDEGGAGEMLLLPAQECHIASDSGEFSYHVVALGLERAVPRQGKGRALLDAIGAAGGTAILAHPRWSWMPYELFDGMVDGGLFEVYNGVCEKEVARGHSSDYWDRWMTRERRALWAVAVDDMHRPARDFAMGWTYVNAQRKPESILAALRRGDAYATSGPRFETIRVTDDTITVHTSAAKAVKFRTTDGNVAHVVEGEHVKRASYSPTGDEVYVRVEVHAHDGRIAWSNPFMIEA